jgi:hypothetical protein
MGVRPGGVGNGEWGMVVGASVFRAHSLLRTPHSPFSSEKEPPGGLA